MRSGSAWPTFSTTDFLYARIASATSSIATPSDLKIVMSLGVDRPFARPGCRSKLILHRDEGGYAFLIQENCHQAIMTDLISEIGRVPISRSFS